MDYEFHPKDTLGAPTVWVSKLKRPTCVPYCTGGLADIVLPCALPEVALVLAYLAPFWIPLADPSNAASARGVVA